MKMHICDDERPVRLALYMLEHNATVRSAAKQFGVSKSTVHKDVTTNLKKINPGLSSEITHLLFVNKSERHFRGGEATKQKYKRLREEQKSR